MSEFTVLVFVIGVVVLVAWLAE
jgi:hypothetical protein